MSTFAGTPSPITLSDDQTPSSIVIIGPSNWLLTLTVEADAGPVRRRGKFVYPRDRQFVGGFRSTAAGRLD
jgi:hypothetical protein